MNRKITNTLFSATLIVGAWLPAHAEFNAPVSDTPYSFESLSMIEGSGVTKLADGEYAVTDDITIASPNTFTIAGASTVKLGNGVGIELACQSDLQAERRVLITSLGEDDAPRGLTISYEDAVTTISNIDFEFASLRNFSGSGLDIDACSFTRSNGTLSSMGALALGTSGSAYNITNCTFADNTVPAIGAAANYACGIYIADCTFTNNNTANTNKPQVNITVGGDRPVTITRSTFTGAGLNMVGAIAVGNLTIMGGDNIVNITDCDIREHRYGITGVGPMKMYIRNNTLVNNNHESNAMNGGSGISLSGYGYQLDAIISGNHIENSLWGVTVINCGDVSLGEIGNPDSPGDNVFVDNGNGGTPYDLYNNSTKTIYAQNNTWSVPEQTAELIETVIFHKADNPSLGEVIYMPAHGTDGITAAQKQQLCVSGNTVISDSEVEIYDLQGRCVIPARMNPSLTGLAAGEYIVTTANTAIKIIVK